MYLVSNTIIMLAADSGENQDKHTLMISRKEYDKAVNQRKVDQGKRNNAEVSVSTCDGI